MCYSAWTGTSQSGLLSLKREYAEQFCISSHNVQMKLLFILYSLSCTNNGTDTDLSYHSSRHRRDNNGCIHDFIRVCVCMCVFWVFCSNGLLLSYSEESSEDMSCGEDSPWGSPGSDGEGAFFPSTFLWSKKWWIIMSLRSSNRYVSLPRRGTDLENCSVLGVFFFHSSCCLTSDRSWLLSACVDSVCRLFLETYRNSANLQYRGSLMVMAYECPPSSPKMLFVLVWVQTWHIPGKIVKHKWNFYEGH